MGNAGFNTWLWFAISEDCNTLAATQRAYYVMEVSKNDSLKVDINYYLAQQLHPVVSRLCDPIDGTGKSFSYKKRPMFT